MTVDADALKRVVTRTKKLAKDFDPPSFDHVPHPLRKKAFLVCKIWERRGWLEVSDPESWEVSADNVLMRLALRSGLVPEGDVDQVREATRDAFKQVAEQAKLSPPVLDDLLWQ